MNNNENTQRNDNERTFTQEEVNNIVQKRLKEERSKIEKEYEDRSFKLYVQETLQSKGLPSTLSDALDVSSKEAFERSLGVVVSLLDNKTENKQMPSRAGFGGSKESQKTVDPDTSFRRAMGLEKG